MSSPNVYLQPPKEISEKYILEGETADGALMFLPSEAVYAELHANFSDIVQEGFSARVWIVSPTTCMATLNTMRAILKDARMREQAGAIRIELGLLFKDVERLSDRVMNLDRHFVMASKDIEEIKISARPGTIIELDKAGFTVVCGFGAVEIHTVQKSGGVKSPAAEYARAVGLRAGMNLDGGEP